MLLALKMPEWLVNIWTVYGDMITPVLVTLVLAIVSAIALKIKSDAKVRATQTDAEIEAIKAIANREDNKPQLEEQSQKIQKLEQSNMYLAEMVNLAFQNSNLTPEVKDNLASLSNKIKYGTEDNLVKELETEKAQLQEQVESLKAQLETKVVATVQEETKKRTRR